MTSGYLYAFDAVYISSRFGPEAALSSCCSADRHSSDAGCEFSIEVMLFSLVKGGHMISNDAFKKKMTDFGSDPLNNDKLKGRRNTFSMFHIQGSLLFYIITSLS